MLHLKLAARTSLRAFCVASVVLICGAFEKISAADVILTFNTVDNSQKADLYRPGYSGNTSAGQFHFTKTGGTSSLFGTPIAPAFTFCIELDQHVSYGQQNIVYNVTSNLENLPRTSYGTGMGSAKAHNLQILAALTTQAGFWSTYSKAVFQCAVWNIVFDGDLKSSSGSFFTDLGNNTDNASVQNLLDAVSTGNTNGATAFFVGLTNDDFQDQITLTDSDGYHGAGGQLVPVPAGTVLAGMGVFCLGGYNFLRRRKAIVA